MGPVRRFLRTLAGAAHDGHPQGEYDHTCDGCREERAMFDLRTQEPVRLDKEAHA